MNTDTDSVISFSTGTGHDRPLTPSSWADLETDSYEWINDKGSVCHGPETDVDSVDFDTQSHTSISPSVHSYEHQHDRRYHGYKRGRYPLPNDAQEQSLDELKHYIMLELANGQLFMSDLDVIPTKVIDVGTGTGTWAIDLADKYPNSSIVGTDLSPIQPSALPPNCHMFVDDCEEEDWGFEDDFDLVHFRNMAWTLYNLDEMLNKAYTNLNPGGWVEFQEFLPQIFCDDDTMKADDPLQAFTQISADGMRKLGYRSFGSQDLVESLNNSGFTDVQCVTKKVPIGTWTADQKLKYLGGLMQTVVEESLSAYLAKPFAATGISPNERNGLVSNVKSSLQDHRIHRYVKVQFCYGQKPEDEDEYRSTFDGSSSREI
ncbi:unnamed protein product [Clonostachys byssicola]|uniref:Secondary metabolism regulator LAE1 n=1 Tax=Clonostachys byssicola TaxID=160290 RepID=A0A9N9UFV3_9HYPO|nr:unnamed protein product [Clonostachys byssicola]